jgi:hypothetical protein
MEILTEAAKNSIARKHDCEQAFATEQRKMTLHSKYMLPRSMPAWYGKSQKMHACVSSPHVGFPD